VATLSKSTRRTAIAPRQIRAISRALSDPRRFQILERIASQSCAACADLRAAFPITAATLSHHLKELESAGLVEITREGKFAHLAFQRDLWKAYLTELAKL